MGFGNKQSRSTYFGPSYKTKLVFIIVILQRNSTCKVIIGSGRGVLYQVSGCVVPSLGPSIYYLKTNGDSVEKIQEGAWMPIIMAWAHSLQLTLFRPMDLQSREPNSIKQASAQLRKIRRLFSSYLDPSKLNLIGLICPAQNSACSHEADRPITKVWVGLGPSLCKCQSTQFPQIAIYWA